MDALRYYVSAGILDEHGNKIDVLFLGSYPTEQDAEECARRFNTAVIGKVPQLWPARVQSLDKMVSLEDAMASIGSRFDPRPVTAEEMEQMY